MREEAIHNGTSIFLGGILLVVTHLLTTSPGLAQPRAEPVPLEFIKGDRLEPPDLGFSLQLPGPSWAWMRMVGSQPNNFQAVETQSHRVFIVLVQNGPLTEDSAQGFVAGVKKGDPGRGLTVTRAALEKSDVPRPGSYRFTSVMEAQDAVVHWTGYLVALPHRGIGVLEELRAEPGESAEFTAFVKSLHLTEDLDPTGRVSASSGARLGALLYLPLWAIVTALCFLANKLLGRPAINPGRVGLVLFFAVLVVDLVVLTYLMANGPPLPAGNQGELFGGAVGKSLFPLIFSAVLDTRHVRKRAQAARSSPPLAKLAP